MLFLALEDAIGIHAFAPLEALAMHVTKHMLFGSPLACFPVDSVDRVTTLKARSSLLSTTRSVKTSTSR
jgi:hypothetical protein